MMEMMTGSLTHCTTPHAEIHTFSSFHADLLLNRTDGSSAKHILQKESQSLQRSKSFYVTTEYDLLIQSLRRTNFFNENTNERRGLDVKPLGTAIMGSQGGMMTSRSQA